MQSETIGLRERKRLETRRRIIEAGMRLFIAQGYVETTLEMIAAEAGIARRTFFAYFKSKDEIVLARERDGWEHLLDEVRKVPRDQPPLAAVHDVMSRAMAHLDNAYLRSLVEIERSSPALMAARHASFAERERLLHGALSEVWPQARRAASLRLVAMVAVGALRVAAETWEAAGPRASLPVLFSRTFDAVQALFAVDD